VLAFLGWRGFFYLACKLYLIIYCMFQINQKKSFLLNLPCECPSRDAEQSLYMGSISS